jgi:hypothetical protein
MNARVDDWGAYLLSLSQLSLDDERIDIEPFYDALDDSYDADGRCDHSRAALAALVAGNRVVLQYAHRAGLDRVVTIPPVRPFHVWASP